MPSAKQLVERLQVQGWLSPTALATLLGLTPPTVNKLTRQGKIIGTTIGGVTRIWAIELLRVFAEPSLISKANSFNISKAKQAAIEYLDKYNREAD